MGNCKKDENTICPKRANAKKTKKLLAQYAQTQNRLKNHLRNMRKCKIDVKTICATCANAKST
jgi:hypothetical protein